MPIGVYKRQKDVWNKGKIMNSSFRKACSNAMLGNKNRWKGDGATYGAKHVFMVKKYGKADMCMNYNCYYPRRNKGRNILLAPKKYHWANISGQYFRDTKDWIKLCPSCHSKFDNNITFKKNVLRFLDMKIDIIKQLEK